MKVANNISRSLLVGVIAGILFTFGETILRIFTVPDVVGISDLPIQMLMGYSSVWMFLIGANFAMILGGLNSKSNKNFYQKFPYCIQVLLAWITMIGIELWWGLVLNKGFNIGVWDYTNLPPQFLGQICLIASLLWLVLVPIIFFVDDLIRFYAFQETHPDPFLTYYTDIVKRK